MNTAVIGTSRKENENRVAIHPAHIETISEAIRRQLFFEKGYGLPFGISDESIAALTGGQSLDRKKLLENFDAFIIPKPVKEDFDEMPEGAVVWGWIHSVQHADIAQTAIDRKMTLIAWENMYYQGTRDRIHIFQKNNEMAGYCGVQHALQLRGIDGNFGAPRKAVIIGFGSVGRGAIYALKGHGFSDITVYTRRPTYLVSDKIPGVRYQQILKNPFGNFEVKSQSGKPVMLLDELTKADIIVNGILQNPNKPVIFIRESDIAKFEKECLIIDISSDTGMGFSFARPTTMENPMFKKGNIVYYSLDHTPTLLWDSASWEISNCLIPYVPDFVEQISNPVLDEATDIKDGMVLNKDILAFQNRSPIYPYKQKSSAKSDFDNKIVSYLADNTAGAKKHKESAV